VHAADLVEQVAPLFRRGLAASEAAAYLRSTVQGAYSLVKRGRLKPMPGRPGRLLFTCETLDNYLSARYRR
jgi:hypothetical protein